MSMGNKKRTLSVSLVPSARTKAILNGTVAIEGVELVPNPAASVDENSRRMLDGRYDVAEMSLATFVAMAGAESPLIGLPIFPGRRFIHGGVLCRRGSPLSSPSQLAGRRVAVPQYWLTSSIWHRGMLQHEYGVIPQAVEWITTTPERCATRFPDDVRVTYRPNVAMADLLLGGEIDAALVPRPDHPSFMHPEIGCIFRDVNAVEQTSYSRDHVFPIMHFIVLKKELCESMPWLPQALIDAFQTAAQIETTAGGQAIAGTLPDDAQRLWTDGLEANRHVIDTFLGYCSEQGLLHRRPLMNHLFVSGSS
jgi:4,5-dihydroxyphthalate decarboxylase